MPAISPPVYQARLKHWQQQLAPDTFTLISNPADIEYFTGFQFLLPAEREAFVTISSQEATLWYASFSPLPAKLALTAQPMYGFGTVIDFLKQATEKKSLFLEFDAQNLTVAEHTQLAAIPQVSLHAFQREKLMELRRIKDATEIGCLKKAAQITAQVVEFGLQNLSVGQTETEVAWALEQKARELGAQGLSFPTIVAFGTHTALPHHQPTDLKLSHEMPVLIDFGARFDGYCGDMTRTVWFGKTPSQTFEKIKTVVDTAYAETLELMQDCLIEKRALLASAIDTKAREIITEAGFGKLFIHTTGHGIGLDVHEPPSLSWRNESLIKPMTCFTVEPGIYKLDDCGYRFENTVLLTETSVDVLTEHA